MSFQRLLRVLLVPGALACGFSTASESASAPSAVRSGLDLSVVDGEETPARLGAGYTSEEGGAVGVAGRNDAEVPAPFAGPVNPLTGQAEPSVSFAILPARGDFAPDVSIHYSAMRPNGRLGAGWALSSEQSIDRHGLGGGVPRAFVDYCSSDSVWSSEAGAFVQQEFCSDESVFTAGGERLVPPSVAASVRHGYRRQSDPFTVYEPLFSLAGRSGVILGWRVTREGVTRTFGSGVDLEVSGSSYPAGCQPGVTYQDDACTLPGQWHLTREERGAGESIDYVYEQEPGEAHRTLRLASIVYNDGLHRVDFEYEARPDGFSYASDGVNRTITERLAGIAVKSNFGGVSTTTHLYKLQYANSAQVPSRSLLTRVWRENLNASGQPIAGKALLLRGYEYNDSTVSGWTARQILGSGGFDGVDPDSGASVPAVTLKDVLVAADYGRPGSRLVLDVNADSLPDLIVLRQVHSICATAMCTNTAANVFLNNFRDAASPASAFVYASDLSSSLTEAIAGFGTDRGERPNADFLIHDFNGDGYADVWRQIESSAVDEFGPWANPILLGSATGWTVDLDYDYPFLGDITPPAYDYEWLTSLDLSTLQVVDVDSDGLGDLVTPTAVYFNSGSSVLFSEDATTPLVATDASGAPIASPWEQVMPSGTILTSAPVFVDFNHDGLVDLLRMSYIQNPDGTHVGEPSMVLEGNGRGVFVYRGTNMGDSIRLADGKATLRYSFVDLEGTGHLSALKRVWGSPSEPSAIIDEDGDGLADTLVSGERDPIFVDLDGDGFVDVLRLRDNRPTAGGGADPSMAATWEGPSVRLSPRTVAPFRLVAEIGTQGVRTEYEWTMSARASTDPGPFNTPIVGAVIVSNGVASRTEFEFGGTTFVAGVQTFGTSRRWVDGGLEERQWRSTALGSRGVVTATSVVHEGEVVSARVMRYDESDLEPPFAAPLRRICEFRMGNAATFADETALFAACDGFDRTSASASVIADVTMTVAETDSVYVQGPDDERSDLVQTQVLNFGDVRVPSDDVTESYAYAPFDATAKRTLRISAQSCALSGECRLRDAFGDAASHADGNWTRRVQSRAAFEPSDETDRRVFRSWTNGELVAESELTYGTTVSGARGTVRSFDHCGMAATETRGELTSTFAINPAKPTMTQSHVRDARCLVVSAVSALGVSSTYAYDGLGRLTSDATTVPNMIGGGAETSTTYYHYDQSVGGTYLAPSFVQRRVESDGSETVLKRYVDAAGRMFRETQCKRAGGTLAWINSLDEAHACASDNPAQNEFARHRYWLRSRTSGDVVRALSWFDARDGVVALVARRVSLSGTIPLSDTGYDVFGRPVTVNVAGLPVVQHLYDANSRSSTFAGVTTVSETVVVSGALRSRTRRNGVVVEEQIRNAFGETIATFDADGNETSSVYDEFGQLRRVMKPSVEVYSPSSWPLTDATKCASSVVQRPTESTTYHADGTVSAHVNANGAKTRIIYDSLSRPVEVWVPNENTAALGDELRTLGAQYEDLPGTNRRAIMTDAHGRVSTRYVSPLGQFWKVQDPDGGTTLTRYDAQGRPMDWTLPTGEQFEATFDRMGQVKGLHNVTFSAMQNVVRDARGAVLKQIDADGQEKNWTYDIAGRVLTQDLGTGNAKLRALENIYDTNGRLDRKIENGVGTHYEYDALNRITAVQNGYVPGGSPAYLAETQFTYTARDQVHSTTSPSGQTTEWTYDALGRSVQTTQSGGGITAVEQAGYDAQGNLIASYDADTFGQCVRYDLFDRPVRKVSARGTGAVAQVPQSLALGPVQMQYTVDATSGSLLTQTTSATGEIHQTFTRDGRVWKEISPSGERLEIEYSFGRPTLQRRFDTAGISAAVRPIEYVPNSSRVYRLWNWLAAGGLSSCVPSLPAGPLSPSCESRYVQHTYTPQGRPLATLDSTGSGETNSYRADGTMLLATQSKPGVYEERFTYDTQYPFVRSVARGPQTDPIVATFEAFRNMRLDSVTLDRAGTNERVVREFEYDTALRPTAATLRRGPSGAPVIESRTETTYDGFGRTASKTLNTAADSLTMTTSWTEAGRIHTVGYPSGQSVAYGYTTYGLFAQIELLDGGISKGVMYSEGDFDASGRVQSTTTAEGLPSGGVWAKKVESWQTFDAVGRIDGLDVAENATAVYGEQYFYDSLDRLVEVSRGSQTDEFTYDARDLLTGELHETPGGTNWSTYAYNAAAQRVSSNTNGTVKSHSYWSGPGHKLKTVGSSSNLTWDGFGRQTNLLSGHALSYGLDNVLLAVSSSGTNIESMTYDTDGQRVTRVTPSGVETFVSGGLGEVFFHKRSETDKVAFVRTPGGQAVAELDASSTVNRNTVRALLNAAADRRRDSFADGADERREYTAFGSLISGPTSSTSSLGFHDTWSTSTSLRIAGVRAYDPVTGRFTAPDPLGVAAAQDPNDSTNFYAYAQNNPVALRDPTGLSGEVIGPDRIDLDGAVPSGSTFRSSTWMQSAMAASAPARAGGESFMDPIGEDICDVGLGHPLCASQERGGWIDPDAELDKSGKLSIQRGTVRLGMGASQSKEKGYVSTAVTRGDEIDVELTCVANCDWEPNRSGSSIVPMPLLWLSALAEDSGYFTVTGFVDGFAIGLTRYGRDLLQRYSGLEVNSPEGKGGYDFGEYAGDIGRDLIIGTAMSAEVGEAFPLLVELMPDIALTSVIYHPDALAAGGSGGSRLPRLSRLVHRWLTDTLGRADLSPNERRLYEVTRLEADEANLYGISATHNGLDGSADLTTQLFTQPGFRADLDELGDPFMVQIHGTPGGFIVKGPDGANLPITNEEAVRWVLGARAALEDTRAIFLKSCGVGKSGLCEEMAAAARVVVCSPNMLCYTMGDGGHDLVNAVVGPKSFALLQADPTWAGRLDLEWTNGAGHRRFTPAPLPDMDALGIPAGSFLYSAGRLFPIASPSGPPILPKVPPGAIILENGTHWLQRMQKDDMHVAYPPVE